MANDKLVEPSVNRSSIEWPFAQTMMTSAFVSSATCRIADAGDPTMTEACVLGLINFSRLATDVVRTEIASRTVSAALIPVTPISAARERRRVSS